MEFSMEADIKIVENFIQVKNIVSIYKAMQYFMELVACYQYMQSHNLQQELWADDEDTRSLPW